MFNSIRKSIKSKYSAEDRKAFGFCYLLLLIPVAQFVVFWVFVNVDSIGLAFKDNLGNFTLQNFKDVWTALTKEDMYGWNLAAILKRTVILWVSVNVICTPLIMFSTYILFKKILGHYVFRTIFAIPEILGAIIWTRLMSFIVSADGPVLTIAQQWGMNIPQEVLYVENRLRNSAGDQYHTAPDRVQYRSYGSVQQNSAGDLRKREDGRRDLSARIYIDGGSARVAHDRDQSYLVARHDIYGRRTGVPLHYG